MIRQCELEIQGVCMSASALTAIGTMPMFQAAAWRDPRSHYEDNSLKDASEATDRV
jgi:hypothetical protein